MTPDEFRDLVTRLYLEHGVFHSIKQMAKLTGLPEHKLRQGATDVKGWPTTGVERYKDIGAKHPSWRYGPTTRHLRTLLLMAYHRLGEEQETCDATS